MANPNLKPDPSSAHTDSTHTNSIHTNSGIARAIHPEQDQERVSHETRSLITFITLLLHALLLLLFAYLNPPERLPGIRNAARKEAELIVLPNKPQAKPKPAPQQKPTPPPPAPAAQPEPVTLAARTARTSKFGMPLQDLDTEDINFDAQADKIQEAMPQKSAVSAPLPTQEKRVQAKQEPLPVAIPEKQERSKPQEIPQDQQLKKPELLEAQAKPIAEQLTEQARESVTIADTVPKPVIPKPAITQKAEPEIKPEIGQKQESTLAAPEHKHTEPIPSLVPAIQATHTMPQAKKQLPTMAQLARGFLNTLEDKPGDSNLTVHGDKNKKPTAEQLKIERYTEKIAWHIQNSLRIHNDKRPKIPLSPHETPITSVAISVRKNGTIRDVRVVAPSGIPALDNFYLFGIKEANGSFPPIPDYLQADEFNVGFNIYTAHHSRIF